MRHYDELSTKVIEEFASDKSRPNRRTRDLINRCDIDKLSSKRVILDRILKRMRDKGYLERVSHGVYTLTKKGKECLK